MKASAHNAVCRLALLLSLLALPALRAGAQSGLYVPGDRQPKDMRKALADPAAFHLLLTFSGDTALYSVADLDLLDSAFSIAFSVANPMLYTMTIEAFAPSEALGRRRAEAVHDYFARRSHARFPIRMARNPIRCSCQGDTVEVLKFEVPVAIECYAQADLPEARLLLNKSVSLRNSVLVTFRNDPDECVGAARGCAVPKADSVIHGYYASLLVKRGAIVAVAGTKDTCPDSLSITVKDHLDYRSVVERYNLVPHRKQVIVSAGYIVLSGNARRDFDECSEPQPDSIFVRIPATQEQIDAKLKFFAKVRTARGIEYKQLPTRKMPGKAFLGLQAPINVTQLDTVYLGKRIDEKELSRYFYEVDSPTQTSAFAVGNRFYVPFTVGKRGDYQLKKPLRELFRIIPEQEEEIPSASGKAPNPEEIIE